MVHGPGWGRAPPPPVPQRSVLTFWRRRRGPVPPVCSTRSPPGERPRHSVRSLCHPPTSPQELRRLCPGAADSDVGLAARRPGSLRRGLRKRGRAPVLGLRRTTRFQTSAPCALRPKAAVCFWGIPGAPRSPAQVTALPGLPLLPEAERHGACRSTLRPVSGGSEHKQGGQSRNS